MAQVIDALGELMEAPPNGQVAHGDGGPPELYYEGGDGGGGGPGGIPWHLLILGLMLLGLALVIAGAFDHGDGDAA